LAKNRKIDEKTSSIPQKIAIFGIPAGIRGSFCFYSTAARRIRQNRRRNFRYFADSRAGAVADHGTRLRSTVSAPSIA
jgi:hypothetical protein